MHADPLSALADRLRALASPTRLRILLALRDGALCVCQLAAVLDLSEPEVAGDLAVLLRAGIVGQLRRGRFASYVLHRRDEAVPWLRLVARQSAGDPQAAADLERATRIRLVPPEMVVASTGCEPAAGMALGQPDETGPRTPL